MVTGLFVLVAAFGGALVSVGVLIYLAHVNVPRGSRWGDDDELHGG